MKKFVMDSAVILNNFNFSFSPKEKYFTSNEVLDEMIDLRSRELVKAGLKQGFIEVKTPSRKALELVERAAKELMVERRLSKADKSILALALDLKLPLLSDDYQVQKVCLKLKIEFDSVFRKNISEFKK